MHITVYGTPAPQGSKRHVGNGVMIESSKKVRPWRQDVKHAALLALGSDDDCLTPGCECTDAPNWTPDEPLRVDVTFYLPRPRGHYGTGRNATSLKPSAPTQPYTKPDIDKLLRSTLDALGEAGLWTDDSRVATIHAEKRYADERPPGALIDITRANVGGVGRACGDLMDAAALGGTR